MRRARTLAEATPTQAVPAAQERATPAAHHLDTDRPLTRREAQVEAALLRGLAWKQVARELGIAWSTARDYTTQIYRKRGVTSRGELIARYYERTTAFSLEDGAIPLQGQPCAVVLDGALVAGSCTGTFTPAPVPDPTPDPAPDPAPNPQT